MDQLSQSKSKMGMIMKPGTKFKQPSKRSFSFVDGTTANSRKARMVGPAEKMSITRTKYL